MTGFAAPRDCQWRVDGISRGTDTAPFHAVHGPPKCSNPAGYGIQSA